VTSRLTLQKLEVFCRVVELGSVSKVAEEMRISQPGVSGHLRSLEAGLGCTLLYWESRELRLTDAGIIAYEWASSVLQRTREAMRAMSGLGEGAQGAAVVGATGTVGTYVLPDILVQAARDLPQMRMSLELHAAREIASPLLDGRCDFAAIMADEPPMSPTLQSRHIGAEDLVAIAAPGSRAAIEVRTFDELAEQSFVCSPEGHPRRNTVDRLLRARGVEHRRVLLELSPPEGIKHAVQAGAGVALLYRCTVHAELERGDLAEIPLPDHLTSSIFLCHRKGRRFTEGQSRLLDVIADRIGSRPTG
jgi:DNA-binding transcriptional LysR family regulator